MRRCCVSGPATYVCPQPGCGYSLPQEPSTVHAMAMHIRTHRTVPTLTPYQFARAAFGSDGPELQHQLATWRTKKLWGKRFNPDLVAQALKVSEEAGEVARAALRLAGEGPERDDKLRGELADEIADVIIAATNLATLIRVDVDVLVEARAKEVMKR